MALRVVVYARRPLLRDCLSQCLSAVPAVTTVWPLAAPDDVVRRVRAGAQVAIIDVGRDEEGAGFDALEAIRNLGLPTAVLALSAPEAVDAVAKSMLFGAVGAIHAYQRPEELADAVIRAAAGNVVLVPQIAGPVLRRLRDRRAEMQTDMQLLGRLTPRECDILKLLAAGHCRAEIAARLHLSPHTVRTHINRGLAKIGASNQLAAAAIMRSAMDALGWANGPRNTDRRVRSR